MEVCFIYAIRNDLLVYTDGSTNKRGKKGLNISQLLIYLSFLSQN